MLYCHQEDLATVAGFSIAGRVVMGIAADRIGAKRSYIICFILMAASLFWLVPAAELWALGLFAAVFGFSQGGCTTLGSPLVAGLFGLRSHGLIYGVIDLGFSVGVFAGPFVAGYIFDTTGSYQAAFFICATLGIIGLILTTVLTPLKKS